MPGHCTAADRPHNRYPLSPKRGRDGVLDEAPQCIPAEAFATDFDFMSALHRAAEANIAWQDVQFATALDLGNSIPCSPVDLPPASPRETQGPHTPLEGLQAHGGSSPAQTTAAFAGRIIARLLAIDTGLESSTPASVAIRNAARTVADSDEEEDTFISPPLTPEAIPSPASGSANSSPEIPLRDLLGHPSSSKVGEQLSALAASIADALPACAGPGPLQELNQEAGGSASLELDTAPPLVSLQPPPGKHALRNKLKKERRAAKAAAAVNGDEATATNGAAGTTRSRSQERRERLKARLVTISTGEG